MSGTSSPKLPKSASVADVSSAEKSHIARNLYSAEDLVLITESLKSSDRFDESVSYPCRMVTRLSSDPLHAIKTDHEDKIQSENDENLRFAYTGALKTQYFYLGFSSGASLQMFAVSVILMLASHSHNSGPIAELSQQYYSVFRCIFFVSFFFSLYGANLFIWMRAKVDYTTVLGVSYAHTYQYVLRGSAFVAYIVFSCFMLYTITLLGGLEMIHGEQLKHVWPMLAFVLPLLLFFCPYDNITHVCFGVRRHGFSQRWYLLGEIAAVLAAPFTKTTFLRSFIADILCSMPKIFTDLQYAVCIYATGTWRDQQDGAARGHLSYGTCGSGSPTYFRLQIVLAFLPPALRLLQICRAYVDTRQRKHIFNAIKFSCSLLVTGLATVRSLSGSSGGDIDKAWLMCSVLTTLYSWYWDVVMDWGLGNTRCAHFLLRDCLLYAPHCYYWAICLDGIMRLGWAVYISPGQVYVRQHVILLLGCVELVRRFMWAIFRVEWEHICRSSAAVSLQNAIAPITSHNQKSLKQD